MENKQTKDKQTEYRKVEIKTEVRAEESGKKLLLRGYPILFNTPTKINSFWFGEYEETILPTALDGTDLTEVYLMVGHNPDNVLGRAGINMRLEKDDTGLFFECELPNTQYARDWYNLIESGVVDGMSFGFTCGDEINFDTMKRTITHINELFEITITPFPAYPEASVVAKRQAEILEKQKREAEEAERIKKEQKEQARKAEEEKQAAANLTAKIKDLEDL